MFDWFRNWFTAWAERFQKREIERLHAEILSLKAEVLKTTGEKQIRLTPKERQKLVELRNGLDPEVLRQIDVLHDAE